MIHRVRRGQNRPLRHPHPHLPGISIPTADSLPVVITPGRHRDLWFGESGTGDKIGRITTGGRITEYPMPSPNAGLSGIALDRRGDVWATEELTGKIARLDPRNGAVTEFPLPTGYLATGLTSFAGRLWFNAVGPQASIGTIGQDGSVTLYPVPTASSISIGITGGPTTLCGSPKRSGTTWPGGTEMRPNRL